MRPGYRHESPDGTDVLMTAGTDRVEHTAESHLRLIPDNGTSSSDLQTSVTTHTSPFIVSAAFVESIEGDDD
jgi:hypothetical protein